MTDHSLQITVTLKLEWNVTVIDKPIPASFTTKVPNGTLLIDIVNKAADSGGLGIQCLFYDGDAIWLWALYLQFCGR